MKMTYYYAPTTWRSSNLSLPSKLFPTIVGNRAADPQTVPEKRGSLRAPRVKANGTSRQ